MNFFQRQNETRRLSRRLIWLFIVAVIAVALAVDAVLFTVFASLQPNSSGLVLPSGQWLSTHMGPVVFTTVSVIGFIGIASLYKTAMLNGGGGVVARSLGGVRVSADTTDPLQKRLLNVVEEMSIASGVPMPEVYLLEQEAGINAFAAGHNPANAAIAVTRGTLTSLNRAELQGVIAHEFSHVLNGDMRINIRLMGLLFGLLAIAMLARAVLRLAPRGRSSKKGGGVGVIMLAAAAVLVVGYVGLFFGRLIQAAVSRSRESLADASAVQFTRDPAGLRGALVKIYAADQGSRIGSADVEEVAHMLFAPGLKRMFATHPSIDERLKAIDPHFDKSEIEIARARLHQAQNEIEDSVSAVPRSGAERLDDLIAVPAGIGAVAQLVGNPGTAHIERAQQIRRDLPETLSIAGRHPSTARGLFLALTLDRDPTVRERQTLFIARQLGEDVARAMQDVLPEVDRLQPEQRLPVLMHAFPALRQLTRDERIRLMACLNGMWQREGAISLHAYVLRKLAQVHMRDDLDPRGRRTTLSLASVRSELNVLFSVLAQHGHSVEPDARRAYEAGMHVLLPRERPSYSSIVGWPAQLDSALSRLDLLVPAGKEQLIDAMVRTVAHDQQLTLAEAELLRAVCAALHCPLPPLIDSKL